MPSLSVLRQPHLYRAVDRLTHLIKILIDLVIAEPQHLQSLFSQEAVPFLVVCLLLLFKMLRPVEFYDKLCSCAIEFRDIFS